MGSSRLPTTSEQDLIAAAQRGDRQAYGALVECYYTRVVNVVYRLGGDRAAAEEAAQDAFLRAWQNLAGYKPEYSFRAWVCRIAVNAALDRWRRSRPVVGLDEVVETLAAPPGESDPELQVEALERDRLVRRAVMALPELQRAVLVLREYGELSYGEMAEALNIPVGTVMSRLSAARAHLRVQLAGLLEVK